MVFQKRLLERLSEKIGQEVTTPAGASVLQLDIESALGVRLGVNTVKRLVGVIPADGITPRRTTLNTIANYLGYPDWELLEGDFNMAGSGFGEGTPFIEMSDLETGARVEICWKPGRRIVIRHDGGGQYVVLESERCKLREGDLLSLSQLAVGFPFVAGKVFRDGIPLGSYHAADGAGITRFNILEEDTLS